jgi:large subunit ribosomal protein L25
MTEKLKAKVALEFIGEAKAVKQLGGVLVKVLSEVEVQCLPSDLPHNIEVNISKLETFQDSIHVKDLSVSPKVEIVTKPEEMVAKIQPPRDVEAELKTEIKEDVEAVIAASTEKPAEEEPAEETKKE